MMRPGSRLRQIGWAVALACCFALFLALTFRVNAVKSDVRLAEREIIALEREKLILETEFQTRANQQQLANWNRVEFGYATPSADQYLENERQLIALGTPRAGDGPDPIRVARAPAEEGGDVFPAMVSPLTGRSMVEEEAAEVEETPGRADDDGEKQEMSAPQSLAERLAMDDLLDGAASEVSE